MNVSITSENIKIIFKHCHREKLRPKYFTDECIYHINKDQIIIHDKFFTKERGGHSQLIPLARITPIPKPEKTLEGKKATEKYASGLPSSIFLRSQRQSQIRCPFWWDIFYHGISHHLAKGHPTWKLVSQSLWSHSDATSFRSVSTASVAVDHHKAKEGEHSRCPFLSVEDAPLP